MGERVAAQDGSAPAIGDGLPGGRVREVALDLEGQVGCAAIRHDPTVELVGDARDLVRDREGAGRQGVVEAVVDEAGLGRLDPVIVEDDVRGPVGRRQIGVRDACAADELRVEQVLGPAPAVDRDLVGWSAGDPRGSAGGRRANCRRKGARGGGRRVSA